MSSLNGLEQGRYSPCYDGYRYSKNERCLHGDDLANRSKPFASNSSSWVGTFLACKHPNHIPDPAAEVSVTHLGAKVEQHAVRAYQGNDPDYFARLSPVSWELPKPR